MKYGVILFCLTKKYIVNSLRWTKIHSTRLLLSLSYIKDVILGDQHQYSHILNLFFFFRYVHILWSLHFFCMHTNFSNCFFLVIVVVFVCRGFPFIRTKCIPLCERERAQYTFLRQRMILVFICWQSSHKSKGVHRAARISIFGT